MLHITIIVLRIAIGCGNEHIEKLSVKKEAEKLERIPGALRNTNFSVMLIDNKLFEFRKHQWSLRRLRSRDWGVLRNHWLVLFVVWEGHPCLFEVGRELIQMVFRLDNTSRSSEGLHGNEMLKC